MISKKVEKVINIVQNNDLSFKDLRNLFNNANAAQDISDIEKETLINEVEKKIRIKFPAKAKKILGGKSKKAQDLLEKVFIQLTSEFDWSANKVGTRVKAGGSMISGKEYVCWYISYKNENGYNLALQYKQKTAEDDPILNVELRHVGKQFENETISKDFPVQLEEEAVDYFKEHFKKLIMKAD